MEECGIMSCIKTQQMEEFILAWIANHGEADVCNRYFHDDFAEEFGGARTHHIIGASPVKRAMKLLAAMARDGKLKRCVTGLGTNSGNGFPTWVYSYGLPKR